jgi:hypothetical protein
MEGRRGMRVGTWWEIQKRIFTIVFNLSLYLIIYITIFGRLLFILASHYTPNTYFCAEIPKPPGENLVPPDAVSSTSQYMALVFCPSAYGTGPLFIFPSKTLRIHNWTQTGKET